MSTRKLYATLIGINNYMNNALRGCIKDVLEVDALLRDVCAQQSDPLTYTPFYLLAPNQADEERINKLPEPITYEAPTFANITQKAFAHLKQAGKGDICVLFYCGHGSQTEAPPEFRHLKSDRQNETLVCVDSRDPSKNSRDLIDKELAYLIWDALEGKDVHCLVIMDCCHSGNNMRAVDKEEETEISYRMESPAAGQVPLQAYTGFNDPRNFYNVKDGKASIEIARYVQLSSAQDFEKAAETRSGGLFTSRLVPFLRAGGTARSYRNIIQSLAITVNGRYALQHPVISATRKEDMDLQFLGGAVAPYKPSYEVRYDFAKEQWILYGGALHGITPSTPAAVTLVKIDGTEQKIKVLQTGATQSILDKQDMDLFDKNREDYKAMIVQMAGARLNIGIASSLKDRPDQLAALTAAYEKAAPFYLDIDPERTVSDYLVRCTQDGSFILTTAASDTPLFARTSDAAIFIENAEKVGRWCSVAELRNSATNIKDTDFVLSLETLEGQVLDKPDVDDLKGDKRPLQPGGEILLQYKNGMYPGFRLSIGLKPDAELAECFIDILYMGSKYGIATGLVDSSATRLVRGGEPVRLQFINGTRPQVTLPVNMDERYYAYGINEITDLLKIFVSTQPLSLSQFEQEELELDDLLRKRGLNTGNKSAGSTEASWTVFTQKLRIKGEQDAQVLSGNSTAPFSVFSVIAPAGFKAKAAVVTADDLQTTTRSIQQPRNIWGDIISDPSPFAAALNTPAGNQVQALEILTDEDSMISIPADSYLTIQPSFPGANNLEQVTIPYGYDSTTQQYIPLGYSDEKANIRVSTLPAPVGNSIKLYFAKLFRKPAAGLVLYRIGDNGEWQLLTKDPQVMQPHLSALQDKKILLLIHGITGDTRTMAGALKEIKALPQTVAYILTYDYDNLHTPIAQAAGQLYQSLQTAGLNELTIVAHSTGVLVAKYMTELLGGQAFTDHLILIGTPDATLDEVRNMITHALNVTGPANDALTGLSFLLQRLQLHPDDATAALPAELKTSRAPADVLYTILDGDTKLSAGANTGNDHIASDQLSYFQEPACRKLLAGYLALVTPKKVL